MTLVVVCTVSQDLWINEPATVILERCLLLKLLPPFLFPVSANSLFLILHRFICSLEPSFWLHRWSYLFWLFIGSWVCCSLFYFVVSWLYFLFLIEGKRYLFLPSFSLPNLPHSLLSFLLLSCLLFYFYCLK